MFHREVENQDDSAIGLAFGDSAQKTVKNDWESHHQHNCLKEIAAIHIFD